MTEGGGQRTDDGGQKSEDGGRRTDDGRRRAPRLNTLKGPSSTGQGGRRAPWLNFPGGTLFNWARRAEIRRLPQYHLPELRGRRRLTQIK